MVQVPPPQPKTKSSPMDCFLFLERCLPLRASDVAFGSDVHYVSDVTPGGVVGKHHITATIGSDITMSEANSIAAACRNITLYKRSIIWYNTVRKRGVTMAESKLREMSMDFSVDIINLVKYLKSNHETIISNQIGRSGTSIGANIHEA